MSIKEYLQAYIKNRKKKVEDDEKMNLEMKACRLNELRYISELLETLPTELEEL